MLGNNRRMCVVTILIKRQLVVKIWRSQIFLCARAEELDVILIFGRTFIFRTDKYRTPGLIAYIFGIFSNFGWTDFYGRIKDSPSAREPLDVTKTFKTFN